MGRGRGRGAEAEREGLEIRAFMEPIASLSALHPENLPRPKPSTCIHSQKSLDVQDSFISFPKVDPPVDEQTHFILTQDLFCTPDYITPDGQQFTQSNKENIACPKSPEKSTKTSRKKRDIQGVFSADSFSFNLHEDQHMEEPCLNGFSVDNLQAIRPSAPEIHKKKNYVSQSAVALRCQAMPPVCVKNPFLNETTEIDLDIFGNRRSKYTGFSPSCSGDGLSRYRTDFHEIEQIGFGNFSHVFKVLKRIDGCMYAVKRSMKPLHLDADRRRALMESQALAALGFHENIVGYYTSWFEDEKLYIQMELCERSLSVNTPFQLSKIEILEATYQVANALKFMHGRGVAHLDVKPDNIYVKDGAYKLGDFGCARLINGSLPIDEGDARYMPPEILNDSYEHLEKVDIFSLGATVYELMKGSPLPTSGPQFLNLREGKIPLLPVGSIPLQKLLKEMMDPNPVKRPSAQKIVEDLSIRRARRSAESK